VAALPKKEPGGDVETVKGNVGEFTIWVGGKRVSSKGWLRFPGDRKILEAVRAELQKA
jgi:hypothetical protein